MKQIIRKAILSLAAVCIAVFFVGLYIGLYLGKEAGYSEGVKDHTNEIVNKTDSLRLIYEQRVKDFVHNDKEITVTETTYKLTSE